MNRLGFTLVAAFSVVAGCRPADSVVGAAAIQVSGGPGTGAGRFVTPRGISAGREFLWVVDRSGRVQKLDFQGGVRQEITVATGTNGFPIGVTALPAGGFILIDTHQARLRLFDEKGTEREQIRGSQANGSGVPDLDQPQRLCIDADGSWILTEFGLPGHVRLLALDAQHHLKWSADGSGGQGGRFMRPIGLTIAEDEIYVADISDRIIVFGRDGRWHREFGTTGSGPGELRYPYGVAFLGGLLYVAEHGNHRIQRFTRAGRSRGWFGAPGSAPGTFCGPWDITVDPAGALWVCDSGNHRMVSFDPTRVAWQGAPP